MPVSTRFSPSRLTLEIDFWDSKRGMPSLNLDNQGLLVHAKMKPVRHRESRQRYRLESAFLYLLVHRYARWLDRGHLSSP